MSRRMSWLIVVAALAVAAPARADSAFANWDEFWGAFTSWSIDSSMIADVRSLILERDAGTIVFEEGRLAFANPIGGRRVAAVFVGRGTFAFAPRSEIEQEQLRRFYGTRVLRRKFERLALVFSDSTLAELQPVLQFRTDTLGQLRRTWNATLPYLKVAKLRYVRPLPITQMLLDGADNGLFWALVTDRKNEDPLFFSLVPDFTERVVLERKPEGDRAGLRRRYNAEIVSSSFAVGDPDTLRRDRRPAYEATHYALDVTLSTDLQGTVVADLDLLAHDRPRSWIGLELPEELQVTEVSLGGRKQKFFQEDENPMVWVRLDQPIPAESTATLRVRYRGLLFEREKDWAIPKFSSDWYPRPWYGADATWDLSFHWPRDIQLVAAGEHVAQRDEGKMRHGTWKLRQPVPWASFDVNFLRGIRVEEDSVPPVTVWSRHVDGAGRVEDATLASLRDASDHDRRVALDIGRAVQFFTEQLGPPLLPELNAVETPLWRYEGYPGLIHVMRREETYPPGPEFTPEVIRAHEVSHQWFGLGVAPATYHDAWMREGFADFCSIWYLQAARKDTKSYFAVLEAWRKNMLERRDYLLGKGQAAGPIWLGTRATTSLTPDDYRLVIYSKGAWVMHMLRNYLLDEGDPTESRFRDLMRGFYQRYRGKRAFTEEFRAEVERVAGEDMGWFFAQWVYGTGAPVCRFTWRTEPVDGQWRVLGRIESSNVSPTFRYPVFIRVNFGPESFSRQRVWVNGPVTEFELPLAPQKPVEVVFNDLQSVLCEMAK
jgi:hypothetical protein